MKSNRKVWILLDDDRALLEIVSTLADLWDKEAVLLHSGSEAMAWIEDFKAGRYTGPVPELALLDIRMPGQPQGDDVARELRHTPGLHVLAIVMMTAFALDDAQEVHLLEQTGADGVIRKPFPQLEDLKKLLDHAINRRADTLYWTARG